MNKKKLEKIASEHQRQSQIHTNSIHFLLIPSINYIFTRKTARVLQFTDLHSSHATLPYFFLFL